MCMQLSRAMHVSKLEVLGTCRDGFRATTKSPPSTKERGGSHTVYAQPPLLYHPDHQVPHRLILPFPLTMPSHGQMLNSHITQQHNTGGT